MYGGSHLRLWPGNPIFRWRLFLCLDVATHLNGSCLFVKMSRSQPVQTDELQTDANAARLLFVHLECRPSRGAWRRSGSLCAERPISLWGPPVVSTTERNTSTGLSRHRFHNSRRQSAAADFTLFWAYAMVPSNVPFSNCRSSTLSFWVSMPPDDTVIWGMKKHLTFYRFTDLILFCWN